MSDTKKPYREPETEIEILNAQLKISKWAARKILELEEKLQKLYDKQEGEAKKLA